MYNLITKEEIQKIRTDLYCQAEKISEKFFPYYPQSLVKTSQVDIEIMIKELSRMLYHDTTKVLVMLGHIQVRVTKWNDGRIDLNVELVLVKEWTHYQPDFFKDEF